MGRRVTRADIEAAMHAWWEREHRIPQTREWPHTLAAFRREMGPWNAAWARFLGEADVPAGRRYWSRSRMLQELRCWVAVHEGRVPVRDEWERSGGTPTDHIIRAEFGSWRAFLSAGGCARPRRRRWTHTTAVASLQAWVRDHGGVVPARSVWGAARACPTVRTVLTLFPSWAAFCQAGGYPNPSLRQWTRSRGIRAVRDWVRDHEGQVPTRAVWRQSGAHPSVDTLIGLLGGSWATVLRAAGFPPPPPIPRSIPELLAARDAWIATHAGALPRRIDWIRTGMHPHPRRIAQHFGGWDAFLAAQPPRCPAA